MAEQKCRVCGRPVRQRTGPGDKKQLHSVCKDFESRLMQAKSLAAQIKWQDAGHLRKQRGGVFSIVNGPLRHSLVEYAPDDPTDPPIVYERKKSNPARRIDEDGANGTEAE